MKKTKQILEEEEEEKKLEEAVAKALKEARRDWELRDGIISYIEALPGKVEYTQIGWEEEGMTILIKTRPVASRPEDKDLE